jgi:large subunit ribosomal protein L15
MPVRAGFKNVNHKEYAIINLDDLENNYQVDDVVTPEDLMEKRLITKIKDGVKVLGFGTLTKKLVVKVHGFSKSAEEAIQNAGGEAIRI